MFIRKKYSLASNLGSSGRSRCSPITNEGQKKAGSWGYLILLPLSPNRIPCDYKSPLLQIRWKQPEWVRLSIKTGWRHCSAFWALVKSRQWRSRLCVFGCNMHTTLKIVFLLGWLGVKNQVTYFPISAYDPTFTKDLIFTKDPVSTKDPISPKPERIRTEVLLFISLTSYR